MTPEQQTAFSTASGGGSSDAMAIAITSILCVFALVWLAWSSLAMLEAWRNRTLEMGKFCWYLIRSAMLISVLFTLLK